MNGISFPCWVCWGRKVGGEIGWDKVFLPLLYYCCGHVVLFFSPGECLIPALSLTMFLWVLWNLHSSNFPIFPAFLPLPQPTTAYFCVMSYSLSCRNAVLLPVSLYSYLGELSKPRKLPMEALLLCPLLHPPVNPTPQEIVGLRSHLNSAATPSLSHKDPANPPITL